jgi:hypothetical protein
VVLASGCGQKTVAPVPAAPQAPPQPVSQTPGEIELSDPKVTLAEPTLVQFEVKYRFTKGQPDKYYTCDIFFPGTPNHGAKTMGAVELNAEGVIKDGFKLQGPPVKSFEIYMSEAPTPRDQYKKISNVVSGPVK